MDSEKKILMLRRVRLLSLPLTALLLAWFVWGFVGDLYAVHARPIHAGAAGAEDLPTQARQPLEAYLAVLGQRTMFRPSVLYETKKNEVVNVLGDLKFLGTIRDGGGLRAFILNSKSGMSAFHAKDERLEDLQIQEIREDRVIFRHGEETLELAR